jgi:hypothetical protein
MTLPSAAELDEQDGVAVYDGGVSANSHVEVLLHTAPSLRSKQQCTVS